jgi:transposase
MERDVTTIMRIRKVAKDGALAALRESRPGRAKQEDDDLAAALAEISRLTETVKELSAENLLLRGKVSGP